MPSWARKRFTPSATIFSASMSRPESVSSRIAMPGSSSSIWAISWRFFSPPEKPSLTERWPNVGSRLRASRVALTSLTQVRSLGASPSMAVLAVRRKLDTETPGTSTGYCMARNSPARARSSTVIASTSAPSRVTVPRGDRVLRVAGDRVGQRRLARAVGAHDRVRLAVADGERDPLEDLLGAVLGLDRDVQVLDLQGAHCGVTPFRKLSTSTYTSPSRTSTGKVATGSVAGRPVGLPVRRSNRDPCSQHSTVQSSSSPSLSATLGVAAHVLDGEDLVAVAGEGDVLAVDGDAEGRVVAEVGERAGAEEGHQSSFRTFLDSSASTVAASCSSSSGTAIRRIRSLKKPCTTRRRASFSSMPRERR